MSEGTTKIGSAYIRVGLWEMKVEEEDLVFAYNTKECVRVKQDGQIIRK